MRVYVEFLKAFNNSVVLYLLFLVTEILVESFEGVQPVGVEISVAATIRYLKP